MKIGIHAGCGPIIYPSTESVKWTNIDISGYHNPDIVMDCLDMRLKFGCNYADLVMSVHHIEHLRYPTELTTFLKVVYDVLKFGGVFRLVVPDLMKVARKYVAGEDLKDIYVGDFFYHIDCPAERFMYFCREWEHKVLFDEKLLTRLLNDAGFSKIYQSVFGMSNTPELRNIDRFESESGCYECVK